MCYSAMVRGDMNKMRREMNAKVDVEAFADLYRQRDLLGELKISAGMAQSLASVSDTGDVGRDIARLEAKFQQDEVKRVADALSELDVEIAELAAAQLAKPTKTRAKSLDAKRRKRAKLAEPKREVKGDYRIYPYQFAPIVIEREGERIIVPARYRVLPRTGVEVPGNYNVFNARRDSLQSVRTWKPLFGHKHAIFPFLSFFEWVDRGGKSVELKFSPDGFDGMWAAALYEETPLRSGGVLRSFSMVTDAPPEEVSQAGHDRCPVFLDASLMDQWLEPDGQSLEQLDELLNHKEPTYYRHVAAA